VYHESLRRELNFLHFIFSVDRYVSLLNEIPTLVDDAAQIKSHQYYVILTLPISRENFDYYAARSHPPQPARALSQSKAASTKSGRQRAALWVEAPNETSNSD
jgi:hypothetical protein